MVAIDDPRTWPLADILPLTRPVAGVLWPQTGPMIAHRPLTVFLVNAFEPGLHRKLATCEQIVYPSLAALEADGWVAD